MRAARRKAIAAALGAAVAILLGWLVLRAIAWGACSWYGYQTNRDTRYAAFIGCMVRVDQQWIPRSELRVLQ
ncbi:MULTISPECIES: hypothetical protein [Pseudomonas]|uniref:hypothetical protein n=1 Tax=Pseudomonas TaxID=286 RepID=UPI0007183E76|nr:MULTISPECIES: hypothetical protein [Pseudomonas]KRV74525.1 hypothetical protein AO742_14940 [Pseudomonas citronellolis]KRW78532.1 hypothetical protein AO738_11955 [Pseudomonas citronellolis]PWU30137.1 hypothetical protein DK254_08420 [Pseudomonas sp. RW407]